MFPDREKIRLLGKLIESYINDALLTMSDITSSQQDEEESGYLDGMSNQGTSIAFIFTDFPMVSN
ncbi:hypothetical protein WUBG_18461 [Wuchereria bancrofti]|uniref:Uncharacterized protein n=1 Tax=Wuchereria bancrofti TaxID=6293 RepID=J9E5L2_WUCBA|nr:hypothetical protein WUBG_18461 [Wuchereria bancrofti]